MRAITTQQITDEVRQRCIDACCALPQDAMAALQRARQQETQPLGRALLGQLIENAQLAGRENLPICQDTGVAIVWVELGQQARLAGGDLESAIHEGVRRGYQDGYLRKSIRDPLTGKNTGDNTPAVIHLRLVPGDALKITVAPKGAGSENKGQLKMLTPSDGLEGVKDFVVQCVKEAGGSPCPPIIVGVGLGGTMEKAALLSKHALLREVGQPNPEPQAAQIEAELLERINALGIGPQGVGGRTTAMAVHLEVSPTHIACLPVAVSIQCNAARHASATLHMQDVKEEG